MSIYKRNNIFWISVTAPNGRRIRKSAQTKNRKAAQEFHDQLKAELWRVHRLGEKPRRSWQQASLRWLDEKEHKADIDHDVEKLRWLDPFLGALYLDEINRETIDEIIRKKKVGVAAATVNRYLALIRSILRAAKNEWEWIDAIPRVQLLKEPSGRVRWITEEEARRLIDELPGHLAAMARFSLSTGLRRSNVTQLRWSEVDMQLAHAWVRADNSKTGVAISVPLNLDALAVLREQIGRHPEFVFVYKKCPVKQTSTKAWYSALKRADISDFKWHDLRHTWASWHVQGGTPLHELMALGGWKTYKTVLRYAHLSSGGLHDAARRVEGRITLHPKQSDRT